MSLSKKQKQRRYGENTRAETKKPVPQQTSQPTARSAPRISGHYTAGDMVAQPEKNNSYVFAGVAFVVAILMFAYYHFLILPQISTTAGVTAPELMLWFNSDQIYQFQQGLGVDAIKQYQTLHRSTGLIFPLIFAAAWLGMISAMKYPFVTARLMKLIPALYAIVFIIGGFMIDVAVANPHGGVGLAALLILLRWILFAACMIQLVTMAIRLVRGKVDSFAKGELPGQQPLQK